MHSTPPDSADWYDKDLLHYAAAEGDAAEVAALLDRGYPVNAFDEVSKTPLHYAAEHEHFAIISLLLAAGADVNAQDLARIGDTPLAAVAATCSLKLATVLLEAGADPTIRGWMQLNALDRARNRKRSDGPLVAALLERAARQRVERREQSERFPAS